MVCKEDVLEWFKDLDSYRRIDVLYELLNMCLPFELRFIGSCIEELGKHTYQELRGPSLTANDLDKLSKDVSLNQGILDEGVRHRVLIYLSLLASRNYGVATWLYRKLLRTEYLEEHLIKDNGKDENLNSEFLLLFTMALHHPAFTFEQKQYFSKILTALIDIREKRISAKHSALGYPPGFGYPTHKVHDPSAVPVKTAPTTCGDSPATTFQQPPGLSHMPPQPPHLEFVTPLWSRPGFPYGAPEVPPFPTATMSPLVSRATSPSQSRSTSPHRTPLSSRTIPPPSLNLISQPPSQQQPPPPNSQSANIVPPPPAIPVGGNGAAQTPSVVPGGGAAAAVGLVNGPPPPPAAVDSISSLPTQLTPVLDQLSQSSLPPPPPPSVFSMATVVAMPPPLPSAPPQEIKLTEEDLSKLSLEEKHMLWQASVMNSEFKPNGLRNSPFMGKVRPYLTDAPPSLILDGENSLHQSNSSSSSPNETPPGTPSNASHGRGRGESKSRANGMSFGNSPGPPTIPDTTSPPPPPPAFSNSSVPYTFPQQFAAVAAAAAAQLPPNRSMFHYNQGYRPTFTAPYQSFPTCDSNFPPYTIPYVPFVYSSPFPARTNTSTSATPQPGCYNCGAPNHVGTECTSQNIEEITQKKTYQVEYAPTLPDNDK